MITVTKTKDALEVQTPYYQPWQEAAREELRGRFRNRRWSFFLHQEASVRRTLREQFGTDGGAPVATATVEVTLHGGDKGEEKVWGLGRLLVERQFQGPIRRGPGVTIATGQFPATALRLSHAAPVTLVVQDVPAELAVRMAREQPGRYRVLRGNP